MDWTKIFSALLIIAMIIFLFPRAKEMLKNSPKASNNDLVAILITLILIIGFVFLLMKSV